MQSPDDILFCLLSYTWLARAHWYMKGVYEKKKMQNIVPLSRDAQGRSLSKWVIWNGNGYHSNRLIEINQKKKWPILVVHNSGYQNLKQNHYILSTTRI